MCSAKNDFVERIRDELEGEGYEIFVTPMDKSKGETCTKSAGWKNGADIDVISMTIKQALRVVELIKDESDGETYEIFVGHKLNSTPTKAQACRAEGMQN